MQSRLDGLSRPGLAWRTSSLARPLARARSAPARMQFCTCAHALSATCAYVWSRLVVARLAAPKRSRMLQGMMKQGERGGGAGGTPEGEGEGEEGRGQSRAAGPRISGTISLSGGNGAREKRRTDTRRERDLDLDLDLDRDLAFDPCRDSRGRIDPTPPRDQRLASLRHFGLASNENSLAACSSSPSCDRERSGRTKGRSDER